MKRKGKKKKKKKVTFQTALDERWVVLSANVAINSAKKVLEEHGMFICVSIKDQYEAETSPSVIIMAFLELWNSWFYLPSLSVTLYERYRAKSV